MKGVKKSSRGKSAKKVVTRLDIVDKIMMEVYPIVVDGKRKKGSNLPDACKKVGIHYNTLRNRLREDKELENRVNNIQEARKEIAQVAAKENIYNAVNGVEKLRPREKIEVSKWLLEKTDTAFQPTQRIESKSIDLNFNMSLAEMEARIRELSQDLDE